MFDFIKLLNVPVNIQQLQSNNLLSFSFSINRKTKKINKNKKVAEYKNLKFEIVDNKYVNISGSIHKYKNNGLTNYNDFTFSHVLDVITDLYEIFNINPLKTKINNIEISLNIIVKFNPKTYIKRNVIMHNNKHPDVKRFNGLGFLKEFKHSQYLVKIYDKGMQSKTAYNILRFEIKVFKMEFLKKTGINVLTDLLKKEVLQKIGKLFINTFNKLFIIDDIDYISILSEKDKEFFHKTINSDYWQNLKPNSVNFRNGNKSKEYQNERQKYYRSIKKINKLIHKYDLSQSKIELSKMLYDKWINLSTVDSKTNYKLTAFLNRLEK